LFALADPTRRAIVQSLRPGPRAVAEIALDFNMSRPAISQHLKILQDAGLLRSHRAGRQNFYALNLRGMAILRSYVEGFWDEVLGEFQAAAIAEAQQGSKQGRRR
jgi:DNA-binding transcriptional ArsR family regulator